MFIAYALPCDSVCQVHLFSASPHDSETKPMGAAPVLMVYVQTAAALLFSSLFLLFM